MKGGMCSGTTEVLKAVSRFRLIEMWVPGTGIFSLILMSNVKS